MFHRLTVVLLFAAGTALAGLGVATLWTDVGWQGLIADERWAISALDDGNVVLGHARRVDQSYPRRIGQLPLGRFGVLRFVSGRSRAGWRYHVLTVPIWLIVIGLFAYPAIAFYRGPIRRRRRRKQTRCLECGYSLVGNTSGICPECGVPVAWVGERQRLV
jgi:hypothetical protein